jgi:uncharacterized protein (DUF952 family)
LTAFIYHLTRRSAWKAARENGSYSAESLTREGFIHCSKEEQVCRVANSFYHGQHDLVLLEIDPQRLDCEVHWEPGSDKPDELFPHIYGPLNLEAVLRIVDYLPGKDGAFSPPVL